MVSPTPGSIADLRDPCCTLHDVGELVGDEGVVPVSRVERELVRDDLTRKEVSSVQVRQPRVRPEEPRLRETLVVT